MSAQELPTTYDARQVETDLYRRWEDSGCFAAGASKVAGKPSFTIVIPPPNVTGVLHMGHALNNTLQDTLVRWRRMQGFDTLWQPGTDHAGIATESVVVKQVQAKGETRDGLGREEFLRRVWAWKEESGGKIVQQLRKLGSSCDWSRERFTMDEGCSTAVRVMFKRLFDAGLIYRGMRMVNWCPVQKTALSDDEVEPVEQEGRLWKLRYDLVPTASDHTPGHIVVETTRPETFFGDTAVAVHPDDERYKHLIGRLVALPLIGRQIPIVADTYADPEKGSGAVKITPAHDPNDYEVGKRHNLALIRCIGFEGMMTDEAGAYAGLDRFVCRKKLLKDLDAQGILLGETKISHRVGHSYRSHVPIEPMVTEQWFVRMKPLADRALTETTQGRVAFHPERWTKVYTSWLTDVRDWCISRQIWWGHRIPAWHCTECKAITVSDGAAPEKCGTCGCETLTQDTDVLDTWFSSALWPLSTLGWPEDHADLARYYPTSVLVTDRGIIYFWVARMVMAGMFAKDKRPFDHVYIHGTVLDERGAKMSKSAGNGIDPLVMIQGGVQTYLGKEYKCDGYGADAVRFTLLEMTTEGQDLKLSPQRFEAGRNFANKVWNAGRFLLMNLDGRNLQGIPSVSALKARELGFPEHWILDRAQAAVVAVTQALEAFRFSEAVTAAYRFFRDDLCDWYLEWSKKSLRAGGVGAETTAMVLAYCFDTALKLLHPGMPFLTEHLWQHLMNSVGVKDAGFLMLARWPNPEKALQNPALDATMQRLQTIVSAIRDLRSRQGLGDGVAVDTFLDSPGSPISRLAETNASEASRNTSLESLEIHRDFLIDRAKLASLTFGPKTGRCLTATIPGGRVHVAISGDMDLSAFITRLQKQLEDRQKSAQAKKGKLDNPGYVAKAKPEMVTETRQLLAEDEAEIARLQVTLKDLG